MLKRWGVNAGCKQKPRKQQCAASGILSSAHRLQRMPTADSGQNRPQLPAFPKDGSFKWEEVFWMQSGTGMT